MFIALVAYSSFVYAHGIDTYTSQIAWSESAFKSPEVCVSTYTDDYRCVGKRQQRLRQNEDCSSEWLDWQYCAYACSDELCLQKPGEEQMIQMEQEQELLFSQKVFKKSAGFYILGFLLFAIFISLIALLVAYIRAYYYYKIRSTPEAF